MNNILRVEAYDPGALIDFLCAKSGLKNDAAVCRVLGINPPVLSKIRHKRLPVNGDFLIRVQDILRIDIDQSRAVAGIPKTKIDTAPHAFKRPIQGSADVESV